MEKRDEGLGLPMVHHLLHVPKGGELVSVDLGAAVGEDEETHVDEVQHQCLEEKRPMEETVREGAGKD